MTSPDVTVGRDAAGLYADIEGARFRGDDLPPEGTWLTVSLVWERAGDRRFCANVEWSADTPSGVSACTVEEG